MVIGRTDEWRQSSGGQRQVDAADLFGCHSRNPSGLAVMRPRQKAGHMTAFVPPPNSRTVDLESRAVPHMTPSIERRDRWRAALPYLVERDTPLGRWARGLLDRAHKNAGVVALAAKLARIAWAVLAHGCDYGAQFEAAAAAA